MSYDFLKTKTVLYVEDEIATQQMLLFNLEDKFKKIYTASNAYEAFKIFSQKQTDLDLVITDIQMPNMSGLELAHAIRAHNMKIHIIFLSAYNEKEYLHQAIDVFASGFVTKPFLIDDLLQVIERAFERDK